MTRFVSPMLALGALALPALASAQPPDPAARVQRAFATVDTDGDGYITRAESDAARASARTQVEARRKAASDARFARLDTDRDGRLSRAEFDAAGRLPPPPRPGGPRPQSWGPFDRMDADGDGRVSLAEAQSARAGVAMRGPRGRDGMRGTVPPALALSPGPRPLGGGRD